MKTTSELNPSKLILGLLAMLTTASTALAQGESASGSVFGVQNGGSYDYTITLNNTSGSIAIGSFWYSWVPGFFYLPGVPSSASAPTGWTANIDFNSIQFSANSLANDLAPGQSIQFNYSATFTPAQLTGNAGHSYVYTGAIQSDPGAFVNIVTVPAPEPSSLGLLATGFIGLTFASRRKLRKLAITD